MHAQLARDTTGAVKIVVFVTDSVEPELNVTLLQDGLAWLNSHSHDGEQVWMFLLKPDCELEKR